MTASNSSRFELAPKLTGIREKESRSAPQIRPQIRLQIRFGIGPQIRGRNLFPIWIKTVPSSFEMVPRPSGLHFGFMGGSSDETLENIWPSFAGHGVALRRRDHAR